MSRRVSACSADHEGRGGGRPRRGERAHVRAGPVRGRPPTRRRASTTSSLLNPVDNTPAVLDGNTQAVLDLDAKVIVGGRFRGVKRWNQSAVFTRNNIFAYDKATGAIDTTFVPQLDGQVTALLRAADGKVYVSGQFRNVNGVAGGFLVKLDPVTGARDTSFNAAPTGMVYDIHLHGSTLFAVGTFAGSATSSAPTAMLSATTGQAVGADVPFTTRSPAPPGSCVSTSRRTGRPWWRSATSPRWPASTGRTSPSSTSAAPPRHSATGSRTGIAPGSARQLRHLRPRHRLLPGRHLLRRRHHRRLSGATLLCDSAARWETAATGTVTPTWVDYTGGDSLSSVAITGAAMYVAGHQRWHNNAIPPSGDRLGPGGVDRLGIAALDVESGVPLSWNPTAKRGLLRGG